MISTSKIKILRVVSRLNIGGPSIHISFLSKELNNSDFESALVVGSLSPNEGDMSYLLNGFHNGHLYRIKEMQRDISPFKDLISLVKLIFILAKEKPAIVHSHMAKAGALARTATIIVNIFRRKKIKIVHTYHGNVLEGYFSARRSQIFKEIEAILAIFTDALIAISKTQKWELSEKFQISAPEKIRIINLGFDLTKFSNGHATKGDFRKQIGVAPSDFLIGIVGRLVPIKNHRMFIDAAKIISDRIKNKTVKFVIVGDGELRPELEIYAKTKNIFDNIIFHGWEKNIQRVYTDLDLLALTSLNEGTPVSIIEAMASSVPVITTGVGGVKDLLGEFHCSNDRIAGFKKCERGILCQTNNALSLANGIEYLIQNGLDTQDDNISKAREFVIENYSDDKLISRIKEFYSQII